ncbi:MAG: tRNA (N6-isopentenyl adenosine(37)-C2)-methylthiotransferase MiaB [Candidatus Magasanikbacteria bacterium]
MKDHQENKKFHYHIITFGCQMNKNDSERIESIFESMNMISTDKPEEADVILMNSCSIRESAEDRIYSFSHEFAKLKETKPNLIVAVTGCMPGRDKDGTLRKRLKGVDLFFPTKDVIMMPKWLSELNPELRPIDLELDYLSVKPHVKSKFQAFVTIQTGCNQFCTYCVVPYARGMEVNRPLKDILDEVKSLVNYGCLEITLLGQIVNHWLAKEDDKFSSNNPYTQNDFAKLLWELNQIEGLERIHWTAPHPIHMDDEVIDALTLPKQLNFIHLPVQSGSSKILKKMNRKHTRELYLEKIKKIREKKPDIAIGTDIIVGFCDETDEDFAETISLYQECDFDISYTAKYSTRSGTTADKAFTDNITQDEKKKRWFKLQHLMEDIVLRKNQLYLNKEVSVLVDTFKNGMCGGNSREMKRINFPGDKSLIGKIVKVIITEAGHWILWGKML